MNVSIVIATCGAPEWEERAIARALPWALIQQNNHLDVDIVQRHYRRATVAEARNRAAKKAEGDWLCFLDADDALEPGYIDAMEAQAYFHATHPALLAPAMRTVNETGAPCVPFPVAQIPNSHQPMNVLNHCVIGTLVQREMFNKVGGFGDEASLEDWALWLRCIRAGAELVYVPAAVYVAMIHPDGRNRDQSTYEAIRLEHERSLG